MEDYLKVLFIILIMWFILYLILEFNIINNKRKVVNNIFEELDVLFIRRLNLLYKIIDVVKHFDKNQFDSFGSNLYDYINNYDKLSYNDRLILNENLCMDIKKILLVSDVYPEINSIEKYKKYENQLIRFNKRINKLQKRYNKSVLVYMNRKKIFPSNLICIICRFYPYNYFDLKNL